jgi:hypothetical protein
MAVRFAIKANDSMPRKNELQQSDDSP